MHARLTDEKPAFGGSCVYGAGGGSRRLSGERGDGHGGSLIWNKRRSMCERINEEKEDINVQISGQLVDVPSPTTRLADFDYLSVYKRHHRPRPIIPRSSSAPNLIDILLSDHPISLNQPHPHPHPPPLPPPPPQKNQQRRLSAGNGMTHLLPRNDSFGARTRGASHIDFRTATTGVIGKAMRNELSQLVNTVQDSQTRKASLVSTIYSTPILIFL
jgi:UTP--glucose-1-phosphate uridylyltransferase